MQRNATDSTDRTGGVSHCVFISDRQTIRRLSQCLSEAICVQRSGSDKVTWMKNVCSFYIELFRYHLQSELL